MHISLVDYCPVTFICNLPVTDLHGYVRGLLDVDGAICNLMPIAQFLEMPEESMDQVMKSWKNEDQQLEMILKHWFKEKDKVEALAALRSNLEGLKEEGKLHKFFSSSSRRPGLSCSEYSHVEEKCWENDVIQWHPFHGHSLIMDTAFMGTSLLIEDIFVHPHAIHSLSNLPT